MKTTSISGSSWLLLLSASCLVGAEDNSLTVVVGETNLVDACVTDFDTESDVDYFPVKYTKPTIESYGDVDINGDIFIPHNTTDFLSIEYYKTYKIVTNHHQDPPKKYLLYQCGTDIPVLEDEDFDLVVPVPHKGGLAITQTPQIPYLELLGLREEVIAYIGNPIYVTSPCMKHMLGANATPGRGTSIETVYDSNSTIQLELIEDFRERHPDALIVSGPTNNVVGDQVIVASATQEKTNVATFDWISFYAAFFNMEGESNRIAAQYQESYDCSSDVAKAIVAEQRERETLATGTLPAVPKVLWANLITWQDLGWSVAECPTWDNAYYCEYATHCGAEIISRPEGVGFNRTWGSPTVYWYLNDEELLDMGKDADVFIYTGSDWDNAYALRNATLDQIKAVQNGMVYDTLGQGASAWNEQRYAEYDIVGLDMCDVVGHSPPPAHGGEAPHERRWFRNVLTEPVGSLGECDVAGGEISEPFVPPPQQAQCVRPSTTATTDETEEESTTTATSTTTAATGDDATSTTTTTTTESTTTAGADADASSSSEEDSASAEESASSEDEVVDEEGSASAAATTATTTTTTPMIGFLWLVSSFGGVLWYSALVV